VDDRTTPAVLAELGRDLARLLAGVTEAEGGDLAALERAVRDGARAVGARLLAAGLAAP